MYQLIVNGQLHQTKQDKNLLTYLREDLRLTSVKNGCYEGACGTCIVLLENKPTKTCLLSVSKVAGKKITTIEGLCPREQEIFAYAFSKMGAVQCGFCTPAMILSAKALLAVHPNPTIQEIQQGIKNNICRCTGYKKIEQAILLAANLLQKDLLLPQAEAQGSLGQRLQRQDASAKALGIAKYTDDLATPNMLYGGAVRSSYPRAKVLAIDTTAAKALPGVKQVLTATDLKGALKIGHTDKKDQYVLVPIGEITTYLGDPIVLIAAETAEILDAAKGLVSITYDPLPPVLSCEAAKKTDAPFVQPQGNLLAFEYMKQGDAEAALQSSAHVVTATYTTPPTEHGFLEPEAALAMPDQEGIILYCGDQGIYKTQQECAAATGLSPNQIRVVGQTIGGAFGGKEDSSVQHHAAILALAAQQPVKVRFSRKESILCHPKRHGMTMKFTTGCDAQGYLTAIKGTITADTGSFASLGASVLQRSCTHAPGPYQYAHVDIEGRAYYTNNPPAGAFRGFGIPQSCFATECNLNLLAEKVGISPWEIRYRNAIKPGQSLPNGQIADESTALIETLEAIKPYFLANPKAGIACSFKSCGLGVGIPDTGRCRLVVQAEKIYVYSAATCLGQGLATVLQQIVCQTLGIPPQQVLCQQPDTATSPDAGNTTASRLTMFVGEAVKMACYSLLNAKGDAPLSALEGKEFFGEYTSQTDAIHSPKPNPISHMAYGYATQLIELAEDGHIRQIVAAQDVGKAINPTLIEGQLEGGITMSLGFGLTEDFPLEQGRPTAKFGTLGLLKATQVPPIQTIIVEKPYSIPKDAPAYGAKGMGELCTIPTAPALQLAYYNYDGKFRTCLPLAETPYSKKC